MITRAHEIGARAQQQIDHELQRGQRFAAPPDQQALVLLPDADDVQHQRGRLVLGVQVIFFRRIVAHDPRPEAHLGQQLLQNLGGDGGYGVGGAGEALFAAFPDIHCHILFVVLFVVLFVQLRGGGGIGGGCGGARGRGNRNGRDGRWRGGLRACPATEALTGRHAHQHFIVLIAGLTAADDLNVYFVPPAVELFQGQPHGLFHALGRDLYLSHRHGDLFSPLQGMRAGSAPVRRL